MKHSRTPRFVKAFKVLPQEIKAQARKAFRLFQENMSHPSLSIEKIEGYPGLWLGVSAESIVGRSTLRMIQRQESGFASIESLAPTTQCIASPKRLVMR